MDGWIYFSKLVEVLPNFNDTFLYHDYNESRFPYSNWGTGFPRHEGALNLPPMQLFIVIIQIIQTEISLSRGT